MSDVFITSANEIAEIMWYPLSVCLSVYLWVLSPGYLKKLLTVLNHISCNDRPSIKDKSIRFWDWSESGSGSIFPLFQHWEIVVGDVHDFLEEESLGLRTRNIRWAFGIDPRPDLDQGSTFQSVSGVLGIKYELRMNHECLWQFLEDRPLEVRITNGVGGGLNSMSVF